MERFRSVDEILNFAIAREEESVEFYTDLAKKMTSSAMSKTFAQFANEERGHKSKLEGIKAGREGMPAPKKIADLKIGDYLVKPDTDPATMTYQNALILAMKKEKAAFKLYNDLATLAENAALRDTFLALAQEEAKHKLRFEVEYDEQILTDN
jgi:rubrerythrin